MTVSTSHSFAPHITSALASVRQSAAAAQPLFRGLVDALSRPGTPVLLGTDSSGLPPAAEPAPVLVDVTSQLAIIGDDPDDGLATAMSQVTGCTISTPDQADVLVVLHDEVPIDVLVSLKTGSHHAPEDAVTVFAACREISVEGEGRSVTTQGPGASQGRCVRILGADTILGWLAARPDDYPAGPDVFFLSDDRLCVGFPRSNRITLGQDI